jgi:hypothetical protein
MAIYKKLGGPCTAITKAEPSFHKYLPPCDSVYFDMHTNMYKYPGDDQDFQYITSDVLDGHPVQIKTFFGKIGVPSSKLEDTQTDIKHRHLQKIDHTIGTNIGGCKTCHSA